MTTLDLGLRPTVSLEEVLHAAARLTRVDRKYLVSADQAQLFFDQLGEDFRVLEIADRLWNSYETTYFDTADLATARAHVQQRRRRWKARSRLYVDDGFARIEVKHRDGGGATQKFFHPISSDRHGRVDDEIAAFLNAQLADLGHGSVAPVAPTLDVSYRRATLACLELGDRVTIDRDLVCEAPGGRVLLDPGHVVIETKGGATLGPADRLLLRLGARPRSFSKYVAGLALTDDRIADNDVRALVGRQLEVRVA